MALGRLRPDALAWGELSEREALFWLEVESGNASRKPARHFEGALLYQTILRFSGLRLAGSALGTPGGGGGICMAARRCGRGFGRLEGVRCVTRASVGVSLWELRLKRILPP